MTTPTTTSAIDEEEGGEAIASNYRRLQWASAGQGQAKTTPIRPRATPTNHTQPKIQSHPNQRATSTWGQGQGSHSRATPANRGTCTVCGTTGAHRRLHCPAFSTTCSTCGKPNHSAHMCWQNIEHESAVSEQVDTMSEGTLHHHNLGPNIPVMEPTSIPPTTEPECLHISKSGGLLQTRTHLTWRDIRTTLPPPPWLTRGARAASQAPPSWLTYNSQQTYPKELPPQHVNATSENRRGAKGSPRTIYQQNMQDQLNHHPTTQPSSPPARHH